MEDRQIYARFIIPALWRPKLYMGCEKTPWLIVAVLSSIATYVSQDWITRSLSIVIGLGLIAGIAVINSKEPYFFRMWWRYMRFQSYYPNVAGYPGRIYKPSSK